ncbi:MAG: tetratricopeptide repeat protein [Chloroflexota bacterium]|nr:tetratricopeptide repeat protein [Chloroflexota bacterium]
MSCVRLYLLGQMRAVWDVDGAPQDSHIQPKPLRLLTYLALNRERSHRRESLQALFWPDKSPSLAASNLRQALWHLRQALPPETLYLQGDVVQWNPENLPWVDALAFEAALDADDLDTALALYAGPLLPNAYDEWAQLERERLHLRCLTALEIRAHRRYEARRWEAALTDANALVVADPLNEVAARLEMACHWALGQREASRRCYDAFQQRVQRELKTGPLPETTTLYRRILRGEPHPDQTPPPADSAVAAQTAHLSLLETLGAFHQGLEQAVAWAAGTSGTARAEALRWQGRFYLRLGQLADARAVLTEALPLATDADIRATMLAELATIETGLSNYPAAESYFVEALHLSPPQPAARLRLLSSMGGLLGRMGRLVEARQTLEEAVRLARIQDDTVPLAIAGGNLSILLINQQETEAAEAMLQEALAASRQADAHWLTAHLVGHLGVLAKDQGDLEKAAEHYQSARTLAETIGDQRSAIFWALNLGVAHYEQDRCDKALPLLLEGKAQAAAQGFRSLEAGAIIFVGACLVAQGQETDGLTSIESGLALAETIGDQERILIGHLHQGRALVALDRPGEARATLQDGLRQAEASRMHRMAEYLRVELESLNSSS